MSRRIAVILFNLGGPDGPDDVRPFLRNLFRDPAIIGAPGLVREALAWLISTAREKEAKANYAKMGGGSPLVPETLKQAEVLKAELDARLAGDEVRIFLAMRYWTPFVHEAVQAVEAFDPDETVLLPLYPQFSTTTTGSSLKAWDDAGGRAARAVCCYPLEADFITAHADLIMKSWESADRPENVRVLFSAHGLPEKTISGGDSYQWQIEQTVAAIVERLPSRLRDHEICYQSRVGPLKWIGPSTPEAIRRASADERHILLSPVAFVSEHIETLVELDEEYAHLAGEHGAPGYERVPALGVHGHYVSALANLATGALGGDNGLKPPGGKRLCPARFGRCPCADTYG